MWYQTSSQLLTYYCKTIAKVNYKFRTRLRNIFTVVIWPWPTRLVQNFPTTKEPSMETPLRSAELVLILSFHFLTSKLMMSQWKLALEATGCQNFCRCRNLVHCICCTYFSGNLYEPKKLHNSRLKETRNIPTKLANAYKITPLLKKICTRLWK